MWSVLAGWGVITYVADVLVRPARVAQEARRAAGRKPLLNVGAGTGGSSVRAAIWGPTSWGDVNCDLNGPCGKIGFCDAHALPYGNKIFGALIASHVVEHVTDPMKVLREFHRVADRVFVICPRWWAAHTWLHLGHRWYQRSDGTFMRLWQGQGGLHGLIQSSNAQIRRTVP